ncbi:MAG: hypothetical protein LBV74_14665 [Tannerella sp.]|jgi:hypothetical protein|nr:hypothetical protein [Tannerella sp.]
MNDGNDPNYGNYTFNTDYKLFNDRLTIGENLSISKTRESSLDAANLQDRARLIQPLVPVHSIDGGWEVLPAI